MEDPGEYVFKLELNTPLETTLNWLAGLGVFTFVIFVLLGYSGRNSGTAEARFLTWSVLPLGFTILAFTLRATADCYYLLDPRARSIDYHYELFSFEILRPFLEAGDVEVVTADGRYRSIKQGYWYEYRVVIVDRRGRTHTMSDAYHHEEGLVDCLHQAKEIAEALGVPYLECPHEHSLRVDVHPGKVAVGHVPSLERSQNKELMRSLVCLGILALLAAAMMLASR